MGFFESFVALRLLRGVRRQTGFLSLSTFISMAGVTVGVMALIVVIGVMTGFHQEMMKKILGVNAHIRVYHGGGIRAYPQVAEQVKSLPGIVSVTPFTYTPAMFSAGNAMTGGVIRGLDPDTIARGGPPALVVQRGNMADLTKMQGEIPCVAIGNEMAKNLHLAIGDYLNVFTPRGKMILTPMGGIPRMKTMQVCAVFHSGMYEFDSALAYGSLPVMQKFLGIGDLVDGLEVDIKDVYAAEQVAGTIRQKLGPGYSTLTWMQMNRSLFFALKQEKIVMFVILTLIILVAAFGIASTLFMMVMRKTRDIAILKSMGATRQSIMQIFVLNGLVIGGIGTGTGLFLGLILAWLLKRYQFIQLPKDVYYISALPMQIQTGDVVAIIAAAMAISFLATLYPSWQAARLDPVEAIRYE